MQQDNGHEEDKENKQEMQVPPSEHEPTATIYIKNFVRPLTHTKVRELLEQYGKIVFFWMDKIKSHCYVKVISFIHKYNKLKLEITKLAHQSLWDVVFPPETGRKLISERKKPNGNSGTVPNIKIVSLDSLFSKTKATPHLYYKPVSSEDAKSRLKVMERRRNRRNS
ncbi:1704_t:CDS:2 [Entrophospora sp. SA101]|nr:1704_t:CDS:2 [Entrophospora sp. SA101]CAJ0837152.1 14047_t:CDS:2 [Entrophospora sp. SA101]CAJ0837176.1 14056_t:CDS:2 [Entrophospora sp. SA101]CAJ0864285.1 9847_t:CDS:2 [Entrophospora sp. SA101]